ncbi:MAG: CBS domain-containing protein [Nanobdellota archaeon]
MDTDFKVYDAMTKKPVSIEPKTSIIECANIMKENDVGSVLVLEGKQFVGIITESDIIKKVVSSGKKLDDIKAENIMEVQVATIEPSANLFDAINTMAQLNIRHIPVVNDGEFIGFLTSKDILKIEPALFEILVDEYEIREAERKPLVNSRNENLDYNVEDEE